jgi:hypothetical protein
MSAQLDAPEAGGAQVACLTLASLPPALLCEVFARTPVDARARCAAVCKAWRDVLLERSLWTRLNLSPAGGVTRAHVTDALLRGAAAKARSSLKALNVSRCEELAYDALLQVVTANAGALTALRHQFMPGFSRLCGLRRCLARRRCCACFTQTRTPPLLLRAACCATSRRSARCAFTPFSFCSRGWAVRRTCVR